MPQASVILPAYRAQATLPRAVTSLLAQTMSDWEAIIIADDGVDYQTLLENHHITDPRLRFTSTGATGSGASRARNTGLDVAASPIIAMLDADDAFAPEKLALTVPLAKTHGLCVHPLNYIDITPTGRRPIATLGLRSANGPLTPAPYLQTHYTANCMLVFDRTRIPARWPEDMPVLNDLIFTMTAYNYVDYAWHLNQPVHDYIYTEGSLSTGSQAPPAYTAAKYQIIQKLESNTLGLKNPEAITALRHFMDISLIAESQYELALKRGEATTFSEIITKLIETT